MKAAKKILKLKKDQTPLRSVVLDSPTAEIVFRCALGDILTLKGTGKVIVGKGLSATRASTAFIDVLSREFPCFISELRARAERAEAELARLKAT